APVLAKSPRELMGEIFARPVHVGDNQETGNLLQLLPMRPERLIPLLAIAFSRRSAVRERDNPLEPRLDAGKHIRLAFAPDQILAGGDAVRVVEDRLGVLFLDEVLVLVPVLDVPQFALPLVREGDAIDLSLRLW